VENACAGSPYDNPHHFKYADADPITDIYANLDSHVTNLNASYQYPPSDVYTHAEAAYGHTSSITDIYANLESRITNLNASYQSPPDVSTHAEAAASGPTSSLILEIGDDFDTDAVVDFL